MSRIQHCCPTASRPEVSRDFEALWDERINRPWQQGLENALGVYGLNHEVAAASSGRNGELYVQMATANMARCKARWSEEPSESEWQALRKDDPEELPWLKVLIHRDLNLRDWKPTAARWSKLKEYLMNPQKLPKVAEDLFEAAGDLKIEITSLQALGRGHWKKLSVDLSGTEGLFPETFRLCAQLMDRKLTPRHRREIFEQIELRLYFHKRLLRRLELLDWRRAYQRQRNILEEITRIVGTNP